MSTTVDSRERQGSQPAHSNEAKHKLSFFGVLRSESLKFRTLVSSWVMLAITIVLMAGFSALTAAQARTVKKALDDAIQNGKQPDPYLMQVGNPADVARQAVDSGYIFAYIILASMAVVFIASEFANKSVISTLTSTPRRGMVYVAKTVQITIVAIIAAIISGVLAWLMAQLVLSPVDLTFGLFEEQTLMNIVGLIVVFVLTAWMGIGLGAIIRNNAGAIVILVVLLFILPLLLMPFQWEWVRDFQGYIPQQLSGILTNPFEPQSDPKYVEAGLWYALWAVVPLILGYFSFTQRDPK
ncbi:ABC transporter permease subunit [Kocuria sp. HSID16901]|uniref:ABC transporter permease subunit n=1 Tax=Kocuria sp. HSID16901 TaxID=2419505 RepID=UPI0006607A5B|nr:ABC transporter permease subunit [Kocuria sp. HSID16901]MCT1367729.1 ABC transporter permease subunit [Rothia sp. p3-SID1597]RUQ20283.1 ABC transporter permease [Kocuria sp. HSID16901]